MDLFSKEEDEPRNQLPKDGIVNYYGKLFSPEQANKYFESLLNTIKWRNDEAKSGLVRRFGL